MKKIVLPLIFTLFSVTGRGQMIPFFENWDMGLFTYQDWTFSPAQGNWQINVGIGNPLPAAMFRGQPALTDYHDTLKSIWISSEFRNCAKYWLEFDLMLDNAQNSSTEGFGIAVKHNGGSGHDPYLMLEDIYNYHSFGWTHFKYQLPDDVWQSSSWCFQLGFVPHGPNSSQINGWYLDNIHAYFTCNPPISITGMNMGSYRHLSWQPPPCSLDTTGQTMIPIGYNVYRKVCMDTTFQKLNNTYVVDTTFDDHVSLGYCFDYYVTAIYNSTEWNGFLCESQPSDTIYLMFEGVDRQYRSREITLFPNPVDKTLTLKSSDPIQGFQLSDLAGRKMFEADKAGSDEFSFNCEGLADGIYYLTIRTEQGEISQKVIVQH
ncbi:MAG: T9SS type A sorting domain-containing protein [Bacteroidetes bacterium]|nr:T9SS type A sorting domain-containing protein [Bacteroidota bacterium]